MGATKEEKQQEQEEDVLLQLFDLYWFKYHILTNQQAIKEDNPKPKLFHKESTSLHPIGTLSDQSLSSKDPNSFSGAHSPSSVLATSTFDNESSYDNAGEQVKKSKKAKEKIKRRCCGISKSLSELEFEEIKGFMDLGFEFSEEDKRSSRLVSILPGLQRLGSNGGNDLEALGRVIARPYLSEVWRVRKNPSLLMKNLRLPSLCDEDEMKNHIKIWAHAVASTVVR